MRKRKRLAIALVVVVVVAASAVATVTVGGASGAQCRNGYVALTFDDGPSATTAPLLLALERTSTKATFFNVGAHEQERPVMVRRTVAAGHWVGNHSYDHPFMDSLSEQDAQRQMLGTKQIHLGITGDLETLYRPPFGRTTLALQETARELGMHEVLWTVDTHDYQQGAQVAESAAPQIVKRALTVKPGGIILMHDAGHRTVQAIPGIVEGLDDKGLCAGRIVATRTPQTSPRPGVVHYARAARW